MSAVPVRLEALLTRDAIATALTEAGCPVRPKTLATMATRGGGPPFQKFSSRPLYTWGLALAWAKSRLGPIVTSTSELDTLTGGRRQARSNIEAALQDHTSAKDGEKSPTGGQSNRAKRRMQERLTVG